MTVLLDYKELSLFFFFLALPNSMWDLIPQPGIKSLPPAVEAWSLNHGTGNGKGHYRKWSRTGKSL